MTSQAFENFHHAIQDSEDLIRHFDALNRQPPPPEIEVLKRASLVMALAALETYFEDRLSEAVSAACQLSGADERLAVFYRQSLEVDLKTFNSPNVDRVKMIFKKYLALDVTEGWCWNNCKQEQAKAELNRLVRKRGDIAHRSLRPIAGLPVPHPVTKDDIRKHIYFVKQLVKATEDYLDTNL
ncbi:HEPN domain-containing protein [Cyanobium gracile UHCC 0139]|uniref:HEPN domain-containing protein n=1 Tax=Cyanobium gracile UHCC 0139 TaxID=3110308 RepID=A0ABU5RY00_9CYAN|nr:HEPN domain-containing protein [Cyanobium gracile]MEA5392667.1 HEPN domain-containing protein [Cyanobium gracile UHCC 0139]